MCKGKAVDTISAADMQRVAPLEKKIFAAATPCLIYGWFHEWIEPLTEEVGYTPVWARQQGAGAGSFAGYNLDHATTANTFLE